MRKNKRSSYNAMDFFWLQVALSFIVGGLYIAAALRVAEAFGPKWGGLILALPSTSVVSFAFIGLTQDAKAVVQAIPIVPLAFGINVLYVLAFVALLPRYGWKASLALALGTWFIIMLPVTLTQPTDITITAAAGIACIILARWWGRRIPEKKIQTPRFSKTDFLARIVLSGLVTASAVYLAKTQGPLWGGLMAGFPAAFTSSMLLLSRRHGADFAASVAKNMPLGILASIGFVLAAYLAIPTVGLWTGLAGAYVMSIGVGLAAQKAMAA